ncbi:hypothetical protein EVAR_88262_1 [Eumeta japonica]|uniref:Uncharacterized protein n=1 Tax=Eumeta variegata TaxID=151549 RepID=A0A4C1XMF7_EUMVA|nr:hypothetical protein EVAR_88262_1 [Eumeta japonica]
MLTQRLISSRVQNIDFARGFHYSTAEVDTSTTYFSIQIKRLGYYAPHFARDRESINFRFENYAFTGRPPGPPYTHGDVFPASSSDASVIRRWHIVKT